MRFLLDIIFNRFVYRLYLKRKLKCVGVNFKFGYMSEINNPEFFSIGENFYSGPFCLFSTNKNNLVKIGDNVMFGPKCNIQGGNHDFSYLGFMRFNDNVEHMSSDINIEAGAWIGTGSTLVSGGEIGEGSIVGAMSLVNKAIPPYVVAAGNPARVLKPRFTYLEQLEKTLIATNSQYTLEELQQLHESLGLQYLESLEVNGN